MKCGTVKKMYEINDKYLYEIIDDFKDADISDKDEILNDFMKLIWSNKNKRKIIDKSIKFKIPQRLLGTEIGGIFNKYSEINYISYRSSCKDTDFSSLIRQKINNIYINLCDERVCIKKEYINLLKKPKQMYYRWNNGENYNSAELDEQLTNIIDEAEKVKEFYTRQKMNLHWSEYKTIITSFFKSMFHNFIPLEDYESKNSLIVDIDTWNEDNFAVAYLCKSLDGYMRNYQKKYYRLPINNRKTYKRCILCGSLMIIHSKKDHSTKYCCLCKKLIKQEKNRLYYSLRKSRNA
jgi:hypothetical protein